MKIMDLGRTSTPSTVVSLSDSWPSCWRSDKSASSNALQ